MKNITDFINEGANFKVSLKDIKIKMSLFANMDYKQITNEIKINNSFIEKAVANKCGKLKPEVTSNNVSFTYGNRTVFAINFEQGIDKPNYELNFSSIASYGSFKMGDDVFNIYEGIGELLRDIPTLELLIKYFSENAAMLRALQEL